MQGRSGLRQVLKYVDEADEVKMPIRVGRVVERSAVQVQSGNGRSPVGSWTRQFDAVELDCGRPPTQQAQEAAVAAADVEDAGVFGETGKQPPRASIRGGFAEALDGSGKLRGARSVVCRRVGSGELGGGGLRIEKRGATGPALPSWEGRPVFVVGGRERLGRRAAAEWAGSASGGRGGGGRRGHRVKPGTE